MGNFVEPLRETKKIKKVAKYLKKTNFRDYVLWVLGVSSGLRVSDLVALNVKDVRNKSFLQIKEKKTKKFKRIPLNSQLQKIFKKFTKNRKDNEPLFLGKFGNRLNRRQVYRFIKSACKNLKFQENVGTHTMRKSFGYHHYRKNKDVAILQTIFNHSSPRITLRYIGIAQDEIDYSYSTLKLCA